VATVGEKNEDMFIRFDRIHERDGRTDRQTDTARRPKAALAMHQGGKNKGCSSRDVLAVQLETISRRQYEVQARVLHAMALSFCLSVCLFVCSCVACVCCGLLTSRQQPHAFDYNRSRPTSRDINDVIFWWGLVALLSGNVGHHRVTNTQECTVDSEASEA